MWMASFCKIHNCPSVLGPALRRLEPGLNPFLPSLPLTASSPSLTCLTSPSPEERLEASGVGGLDLFLDSHGQLLGVDNLFFP